MRRILILVALLAGGATLFAQQRAMFILNDGERVTGTVMTRSMTRGYFGRASSFLVNVNNQQRQLSMNDVAVIDFDLSGARPSTRELNALQSDGNHVIVMRDGRRVEGRLMALDSDTARWSYEPGDTDEIPISEIRRIYLNPDAARNVYTTSPYGNQYGAAPGRYQSGYGGRRTGGLLTPANGLSVPATEPWTDTGIDVQAGDLLSFHATGEVAFGSAPGQSASPDGNPALRRNSYPVPSMPVGGLVGRVGRTAFRIGSSTGAIRMPASGRLLLGVNDDQRNDNSGAFDVVIRDASDSYNPSGYSPSGYSDLLTPANGLQVPADAGWVDTGVTVRRGQLLSFAASGQIMFGLSGGMTAPPDGNASMKNEQYPLSFGPVGALIGRVGNSAPFMIGSNRGAISMPASGRLDLAVNDDQRGDNSGAFNVVIRQR